MLEPVTSRDRCVRGRSLGRTESSLTFGRHRPPRENHSAGMGYGSRWCRQPESLRGSIAARTNENARLRQQLEAAATVVATLHHRRENIGRNGRSRRLVTRGRQDAAFVIVGSVGNSSPEGARRLGRRRRGSGRAGSSLLASWASLNGVPITTDTTDTHRQLFRPEPALSHRNRHHHPSPVPGAMHFTETLMLAGNRVIDGVDVAVVHCSPSAITECGCDGRCRRLARCAAADGSSGARIPARPVYRGGWLRCR